MKNINLNLWTTYKFILFLCLLQSFRAWFFWDIEDVYVNIFILLNSFFLFVIHKQYFTSNLKSIIWFFILLLASISTATHSNFFGILGSIFRILPVYFIITLKSELKFELFISIRKWFSILLFISLIGWVLFLLGIDLPNSTLYYGKIDNSFQYSYSNYFIFLSNNMVLHRDYFRFSSVFLEPGYLGCLLSVFLFLSKYKFDKINIIFFFAIFFTFSLAGYIISIFGYLLFTFRNTRRKVLWVVITFLCYFMIIYFAKNINNGENWINNAIVERLQPDDLKLFSGYNRSSEESDNLFWNSFIYSEDLLFGNGKTIEYNDVDWKSYIYAYGLISFLLYIFYLFFPLLIRDKNKYFTFIFVSIYLMIFAQTIHGMFWLFYLFLFIIGIDVNRKILKKS